MHSNLERLAGAFLTDTGHKIIDKNGVTSEVREEWKSGILQSIDNAKKEIIKRLQDIEKRQNE